MKVLELPAKIVVTRACLVVVESWRTGRAMPFFDAIEAPLVLNGEEGAKSPGVSGKPLWLTVLAFSSKYLTRDARAESSSSSVRFELLVLPGSDMLPFLACVVGRSKSGGL